MFYFQAEKFHNKHENLNRQLTTQQLELPFQLNDRQDFL